LRRGSRIPNWVGILSRGILLPKIVVSLGVNRTDAGWLGNGIYFGDAICTSAEPVSRSWSLKSLMVFAFACMFFTSSDQSFFNIICGM
jgi:hypothetical protein